MIQRKSDLGRLQDSAGQAAALLRAVGNPQRLLVLCLLISEGEMSVGALNDKVPLSPSALSQHLARMREKGLVAYRREAQTLYYRIEDPSVAKLVATLKDIFCP
ncbi:MAG: metalloregulator ArsR/SmtB family transcription factor [Castellaniella sp.]|uniref:ArsR/SmtB family transcription factor n=1 Tax=Castellaniella sp. TaxID=1955812 RepID=UPI003C710992